MHNTKPLNQPFQPSRREFLVSSAAAALSNTLLTSQAQAQSASAGQADVLRIGLIGCGARGTGAAAEALLADRNTKLTAMGDAFPDRVESSLAQLQKNNQIAARIDVPSERRFVGYDAYQRVIESKVDVVILAEPPHFRPRSIKAAVEAGIHVFAEKPIAVDAPGVRLVMATCEEAKKKNLSIVSGLCLRHHFGFQEVIKRIHAGSLGPIRALQANDFRSSLWVTPRQPGWTDMEWQVRNWLYFTWLSGDFNVEQHVHFLDICSWAMNGEYPVKAFGMGGRQVRTGPEYGNIFDHHAVIYEYANGTKLFAYCRQQAGVHTDVGAYVMGARGTAEISLRRQAISAEGDWVYAGPANNIYLTEHEVLFSSIRSGRPRNDGEYMCKSTLLAIMGRMATYSGQLITWTQAWNSREDLTPPASEWGALPIPTVAVPGVTRVW